ncbi:MAG: heavy-metal-associated domain-containing protein [Candidatus Cyclobacteriaceae bacterium M3_2C_046]
MKSIYMMLLAVFMLSSFVSPANAQQKIKGKLTESTFEVKGVCKMCKERIEDAAIYTKGVKYAQWDQETQKLQVVFKPAKVSEETIHQNIAKAGHTTNKVEATAQAYQQLPACCKYLEVDSH